MARDSGTRLRPAGLTRQRIVDLLQRRGTATATELARACGVTDAAMRQHLERLETDGLVERERSTTSGSGRGRPASAWRLRPLAERPNSPELAESFPDRHDDLAIEVLQAITARLGDSALVEVLGERSRRQVDSYRRVVPKVNDWRDAPGAAAALARSRDAEGYKAESRLDSDGSLLLVEHHCPIGEAATSCAGLCSAEIEVFRDVLGPRVSVEREKHLLAGDDCCAYRIRRK